MIQHTNWAHLEEGINTYLNNHNIGPLVQETIISHTRNSLIDNNHPRHQPSLAMLREVVSRQKKWTNIPEADKEHEKISFNYTLDAIEKMQDIGLSQETISAIVESIYDLSLNYYNSKEKIRSLGKITFWENILAEDVFSGKKIMVDNRYHEMNIQKNIENNVWWECSQLAIAYRDIFHRKWINRLIKKDLAKNTSKIEITNGNDRKYFDKEPSNHVFCFLTIWKIHFVIDPSLGEINLHTQWWYKKAQTTLQKVIVKNIHKVPVEKNKKVIPFRTSDLTITKSTEGTVFYRDPQSSSLFLWAFDNTDYMFWITYVEIERWGRKYPCIFLYDANKDRTIWILYDKESIWLNRKNISDSLKESIKKHLIILDSITEYS